MNQFKTQVEAQGYTFDWSITNGQISVTTNVGSFLFDGPDDNALVAMGLKNGTLSGAGSDNNTGSGSTIEPSNDPISFVSNGSGSFTAATGFTGSSALQGGVGGLTLDTVFANQAGSYTIDQNGKNAFTLNVEAGDTVGDIINKINASGLYTAHLNSDGKFVITAVGAATGTNSIQHLSESEAIAQGYTIIKTAQDLQNINNNLDGKYMLMGDIDLSSIANWTAIGTNSAAFTGEFNGNGYTISNLKIDNANASYQGLFGVTNQATISNVNLKDVNIKSNGDSIGGLVGIANDSTIENVTVSGNVEGKNYVGLLVGASVKETNDYNPLISNAYVTGIVKGNSYVGGLVGNGYGVIENSGADVDVTGLDKYIGGLVGYYYLNISEDIIQNCYATGSVNGLSLIHI